MSTDVCPECGIKTIYGKVSGKRLIGCGGHVVLTDLGQHYADVQNQPVVLTPADEKVITDLLEEQ